jgi:cyclic-di-GMP-binding protein
LKIALRFNENSVPVILPGMPDNSFDVVSIVDMPEVLNAVQQASKEVLTRFDLKNSKSEIQLNEKDKKISVTSADDFKLKAVVDILQQKLVKRKVPLKNFTYGSIQPAAGSTVRQEVTIQSGLPVEKSKEIVRAIKDSKIKVQASIQGDLVRVSGKSRDLLQEVIHLLRQSDFGLELQFTNYRTN